jgi:hypothetical protein
VPSVDHGAFLFSVLNQTQDFKYSAFIGGHDVWQENYLECLHGHAESDSKSAIVFTDSYKLDPNDTVVHRYESIFHVSEVPVALRPHYVLTGITYNIMLGGLWREEKRKLVPVRHQCSGVDHLLVAEMTLRGNLIYAPGSILYMRDNSDPTLGHGTYAKKHLPEKYRDNPILDFALQLEWVSHLIDEASKLDPFYQQGVIKNLLKNSLITTYISRYWNNLLGFEGGFETFFNNHKIQQIIDFSTQSNAALMEFLEENLDIQSVVTHSVN